MFSPRGLIFVLFLFYYYYFFFVVGEWGGGGGGQGLIIGILRHVIFHGKSFRLLGIQVKTPGARFSKFMFIVLFFSHNFNTNKVNFHAKFNVYPLLSF